MKITYVHQYYRRPEEGGALRSWRISKALLAAGHEVTMITAHPGAYQVVQEGNLSIHYLPIPYASHFSAPKRILAFFRFLQQAKKLIQHLPKPDLLYLTSTPLTIGFIGPWAKRKWKIPYVFEVRDLWPEAPIQMGTIRQKWLIRWLRQQEKKIYENASHLIALSPGMEEGIRSVVPNASVSMIPNMADQELFGSLPARKESESALGLSDTFRITYTGAMGPSNGLGKLISLVKACSDLPIEFVFAGNGPSRKELEAAAASLPALRILEPLDSFQLRFLIGASDVLCLSFADIPILQTNSPNKFFDALAAGKPVLAATDGWIADLVRSSGCGLDMQTNGITETKEELEKLLQNPSIPETMGISSRALARQFDAQVLSRQLVKLIEEQISDPARP